MQTVQQGERSGRVFKLILDNFRRRAAGVFFSRAEQIGVIALPLIADQLLQLLKERRVMREKVHSRCPLSRVSSPESARASADFPLPLLPTKAQLASLHAEVFNI